METNKDDEERGRTKEYSIDGYKRMIAYAVQTAESEFRCSARLLESYYKKLMKCKLDYKKRRNCIHNIEKHFKTMADTIYFYTTSEYEKLASWVDMYEEPTEKIRKLKEYAKSVLCKEIWDGIYKEIFEDLEEGNDEK